MVADDALVRSGNFSAHGTVRASQTVRVKPNTKYRISVWAVMPGSNLMRLEVFDSGLQRRLAYTDSNGRGSPAWGSLPDWTRVVLEFGTGEHSRIVVRCGSSSTREFWLDDFEMVEDPGIVLGDVSAAAFAPTDVSAEERERGFIVFGRHWMERTSSVARPRPGERTEALSLRLTPGEYGPLAGAAYALQDLRNLRLVPEGPLAGPAGRAIGVERIQVKAARESRHYRSSTQWETYPLFLPPAAPADLSADPARLFWVTVQAPEDAPAGTYEGAFLFPHGQWMPRLTGLWSSSRGRRSSTRARESACACMPITPKAIAAVRTLGRRGSFVWLRKKPQWGWICSTGRACRCWDRNSWAPVAPSWISSRNCQRRAAPT